MKHLNQQEQRLVMRQIAREGYVELARSDGTAYIPLWAALSGSPPVEGVRPAWEDASLLVYGTSFKEALLGSFDLAGASLEERREQREMRLLLPSGSALLLRVPGPEKSLRKWAGVLAAMLGPETALPPESDGLERRLSHTVEEMAFAKSLAVLCAGHAEATRERSELLDKRYRDLRYDLEHRKKVSVTSPNAAPRPAVRAHHQGASVELLLKALRERNATPKCAAQHLYSALGHRPHAEEAAAGELTPGTANLITTLPRVPAAQQLDELRNFVARDDPYALNVLKEYALLFLRLRGLDVDLALRRLLYHFKLPKESQQISRVIRAFAECFVSLHAGLKEHDHSSSAFPVQPDPARHYGPGEYIDWVDAESVEIIVFALVMLNGDLHNPENTEKMTRQQFIDNISRSGANVAPSESTLSDWYTRIRDDPILFDNKSVLYPDAVRKTHLECKVAGVPGLRMWTRVWCVLCENYDVTAVRDEERAIRSGGYGLLYLCRSSRDESTIFLTFPLKRTVVLEVVSKREFTLTAPNPVGTGSAPTLRKKNAEETKVRLRTKTDSECEQWVRSLHYLLSGGFGFWYPMDVPEDDEVEGMPAISTTTKKKRRPKKGTLKKKKTHTASNKGKDASTPAGAATHHSSLPDATPMPDTAAGGDDVSMETTEEAPNRQLNFEMNPLANNAADYL